MAVIPIKDLCRHVRAGDTLLVRPDLTECERYTHKSYPIFLCFRDGLPRRKSSSRDGV